MRVYAIHRRGPTLRFVPDGFSFAALLFGPLWLFVHRAWLSGLAMLLAELLLHALEAAHPSGTIRVASEALRLTLDVAVALFGNDWRAAELRFGGFHLLDRVAAAGPDHALLRHLDRAIPAWALR